ncbi:E3 ubiquitin-protein ligase TRIM8 [Varanus komodoensis]|nr:E3 ubiquitin-protein ligase TRIM8 [Varanus komodoensis]
MRKAGLDESPVGIKIAGRNINNLRYADDTILMAESEEELKRLLMWVKEESAKVGLKLNIKKTKIMASSPLTSWQIDGEEMEIVTDFIFLGSKITADGDCSQEIKRRMLLGRKAMANLVVVVVSHEQSKLCIPSCYPFPVLRSFPPQEGHFDLSVQSQVTMGKIFNLVTLSGEAWAKETGLVRCPECNQAYNQKPNLEKNLKLTNIVEKFNSLNLEKTPSVLHCVFCRRGPPLPAQKICLRCEAPCCQSHVQTHLQQPSTARGHLLVEADDVRAWSCPQHNAYRLYHCEAEQVAVCQFCCYYSGAHQGHSVCDVEIRRNEIRAYNVETCSHPAPF